jgi:hypothetical protein
MKYFAAQARARREEMSGVRRFFHDHAPRWRPRPGLVEGLARNLSRDKALDGLERQYQKAAKTFETQGIRLRNAEISLGRWERANPTRSSRSGRLSTTS